MGTDALGRVRRIALALPGVTERRSHGAPCFFVGDRRPLCYVHDHHRGDARVSLWCPAPPDVPDELATTDPSRFFRPQPSASGTFAGWLGMYLDPVGADAVDWAEVAAVIDEAYRLVAPRRLVAELDERTGRRDPR